MVASVGLEFVLNNYSLLGTKINCLASSFKNVVFFLSLYAVLLATRLSVGLGLPVIIGCVHYKDSVIPALSNTIFSIHPPLLYAAVLSLTIRLTLSVSKRASVCAVYMLVSMFLGGF